MIYGYCRCSTNESKQDINRQVRELKKFDVKEKNIFWEYESGTKTDRKELTRLFETIKSGDTIATTEVSRLTRSTKQLCEIIQEAQEKKLKLIIGSFVVDCSQAELDPMTKGMLMMWGVFSEMERDMISQRVKSGMENAKAKGKKIGRPKTTREDIPTTFLKYYPMYKNGNLTKKGLQKLCELSYPSVYKYLKILEG